MSSDREVIQLKDKAMKLKDEMEEEMIRLARKERDDDSLQLIPRTQMLRRLLNEYFEILSDALTKAMRETGLVKTIAAKRITKSMHKNYKICTVTNVHYYHINNTKKFG